MPGEVTGDCAICGQPLPPRTRITVCRRNPECAKEAKKIHDRRFHQRHRSERRAAYAAKPPREKKPRKPAVVIGPPCLICSQPVNSKYGVCLRTTRCRSEHHNRMIQNQPPGAKILVTAAEWKRTHPLNVKIIMLRRAAKVAGVPFEAAAIEAMWPAPPECPGCKRPIARSATGKRGPAGNSPILARIVPEPGFVAGNLFWACRRCQVAVQRRPAEGRRVLSVFSRRHPGTALASAPVPAKRN